MQSLFLLISFVWFEDDKNENEITKYRLAAASTDPQIQIQIQIQFIDIFCTSKWYIKDTMCGVNKHNYIN